MKGLLQIFTKWQWAWIVIFLVVGIGVRLYDLGNLPNGLYWDEAAILVDARAISETGRDMHGRPWYQILYPSYGDYKQPIYIWFSALAVKAFGTAEWVVRLPSAVAGIITMLVSAGIALQLGKVFTAKDNYRIGWWPVMVIGVLSISPWSIMFSRTGFEANVAQLLLAVSVYCMLLARERRWWLILAVLSGIMATYTYFSVRFVWPLVLLGFGIWWSVKREQRLEKIGWLVGCALFFGLLLLPMLNSPLYEASNRFRLSTPSVLSLDDEVLASNILREQSGNQPVDRVAFHRYWLLARNLWDNYSDHLDFNFLFFSGDANLRHGTTRHGIFLWPLILPFVWGWRRLGQNKPVLALWLAIWWLAALLPASVPETTPHALRSLNALVPLSLVTAFGLASLVEESRKLGKLRTTALFSLIVLTLLAFGQFWQYYTELYPRLANDSWQGQYRELAQQLVKYSSQQIHIVPFDDRFYLWLMLYGTATPRDWQAWKSEQFIFKSMPNFVFSPEVTTDEARIIAGESPAVADFVAKNGWQITKETLIKDDWGNHRFTVVEIE